MLELEPTHSLCYIIKQPNEILLQIAEELTNHDDINSLARACRTTFAVVNPHLYRRSALRDSYALLWAAGQGIEPTAQLAIRCGANVNATIPKGSAILSRIPHRSKLNRTLLESDFHDLEGSTPLVLAILSRCPKILRLLLEQKGIQVNAENTNRLTPLKLSIAQGYTEGVRMLLDRYDIDINSVVFDELNTFYQHPPLVIAAYMENIEHLQLLLSHKRIDPRWPTGNAYLDVREFKSPDIEVTFKYMKLNEVIRRNLEFNRISTLMPYVISAFDLAFWTYDGEHMSLSLNYQSHEQSADSLAVLRAALCGNNKVVETLLRLDDIEVNKPCFIGSKTLLIVAAIGCRSSALQERMEYLVQMLLKREDIEVNAKDWNGRTALHWAAFKGNASIVGRLLADNRVLPTQNDYWGETALYLAIEERQYSVIDLWLAQKEIPWGVLGASPANTLSMLHVAALCGHCGVIEQLLAVDDIDINSSSGFCWSRGRYDVTRHFQTPIELAIEGGHLDAARLILNCPKFWIWDDTRNNLLTIAASRGYIDIVEGLQCSPNWPLALAEKQLLYQCLPKPKERFGTYGLKKIVRGIYYRVDREKGKSRMIKWLVDIVTQT